MPNFYNLLRARKFTTASDTAVEIAAYDSATPNFTIDAGGKLSWSSGSANADTNLYRSAANTLKTDDSFDIASGKTYKIDGTDVLTGSALGSGITSSSLTSVGNLTSLTAATPSFTGPLSSSGSNTLSGRTDISEIRETIFPSSVSGGILTCDYNNGCVFYLPSGASGAFIVNLNNVPTENNYATTISIMVNQGSPAGYPSGTTLNINGSSVSIKWANSTAPTSGNANKVDIWNFTLIRYNDSWSVLGSESKNYGA